MSTNRADTKYYKLVTVESMKPTPGNKIADYFQETNQVYVLLIHSNSKVNVDPLAPIPITTNLEAVMAIAY